MPTDPFHPKGDARLMQDILTYSPTQPDAQAQADATANERAVADAVRAPDSLDVFVADAAQAQPLTPAEFVRMLREKRDDRTIGIMGVADWIDAHVPLIREAPPVIVLNDDGFVVDVLNVPEYDVIDLAWARAWKYSVTLSPAAIASLPADLRAEVEAHNAKAQNGAHDA